MRRFLLFTLFIWSVVANAQDINTDYQTYRKELLNGYQKYRKGVLDDYADYLAGIWEEFQVFKGEKRVDKPKPVIVPNVEDVPVSPTPQTLPIPDVSPNTNPQTPDNIPPSKPIKPIKPVKAPTFDFTFYGVKLNGVRMNTYHVESLEPSTISQVWRKYQAEKYDDVLQSINSISRSYGLNDWFTFELVRCYTDAILKNGTSADRIVLQHYILTNLGFNVRLASTKRQLLLLLPCKQQMYERSYLVIDGQKHYIFYDNISPITENSASIYTCSLPQDADKGLVVNLVYNQSILNLKSGENRECVLTDGRIKITGTVNCGMMEMLRHYPLMDVPCYAASEILPPFHKNILEQIRPQITAMSQRVAANALLHFVQYAFDYSTDGDQHGYEKPYFLEENFFYPKNDCEDRSIFYAFLIRNLLGLDVHLVQYPGHECTAVHFTDNSIVGDGYIYKNQSYIICDPTYIGASVGQCMPMFINTKPIVELWY